ncbi:MAG: hypothetical protein OXE79_05155 [Acidimicrobiaceae bacterium]|nr:hypothetical protein [Acidimicrobiaceae bacterium]MCY4281084.1 hypothetical protein [Acidimicrobiaceae bacterium]MCY4293792.1 hypothetical protein [Acidimicrobiaceae bacterium]
MTGDHVRGRVAGMLRCVDADAGGSVDRRLGFEEFHDLMDRIAEHLDNEAEIADPSTWGQASTGDMEIRFVLEAPPVGGPELNQRIGSILKRLGDEVGLAWSTRPSTGPRHGTSGMMLTQTRQICELAPA